MVCREKSPNLRSLALEWDNDSIYRETASPQTRQDLLTTDYYLNNNLKILAEEYESLG